MKKKPFIVIEDSTARTLSYQVNKAIAHGYSPQGSMSVCTVPGGMLYSQAMVLLPPELSVPIGNVEVSSAGPIFSGGTICNPHLNDNWSARGGLPNCLCPP